MKHLPSDPAWGTFFILLGISAVAFVGMLALMTWSHVLP